MKKTAICISGHLRNYKLGYQNILEKIIKPNCEKFSFDFFIHTWNEDNWKCPTSDGKNHSPKSLSLDEKEDIINTFKPKEIIFEKNINWNTSRHSSLMKKGHVKKRSDGSHVIAMYYKIFKCNQLKKKEEAEWGLYDMCFRTRSDLFLGNNINLNNYLTNQSDTIFIPGFLGEKEELAPLGDFGLRDVWAFSCSRNIDYYSSLYSVFDDTVKQYNMIRPETLLYYHLKKNKNIKYSAIPSINAYVQSSPTSQKTYL
jgi:hypothetical protein